MTTHPMTDRQIRRAAEREARKAEIKQPQAPVAVAATLSPAQPPAPAEPIETAPAVAQEPASQGHAGSIISQAQLAANRANAQLSTGPTSPEGREKSSQNRITHGLSGRFRLLGWEDPIQFQHLVQSLYEEHKPATDAERRLVDSMTQHFWLMQRALTLQNRLMAQPELDHKTFSLYLRYQTTNERAYYRARRELATTRKEQSKQQNGFESQKRQQEAHEAKIRLANAKASAVEIDTEVRTCMEAPLPGHINVPFSDLKDAFRATLSDLNRQYSEKLNEKAAA